MIFTCPKCLSTMKQNKYGFVCTGECGFWIPREIRQKVLLDKSIEELTTCKETQLINGFHKKGNSQTFSAKLYISDTWKIKFRLSSSFEMKCPLCKNELYLFDRGYRCSRERKCGYVLWRSFCGIELSDNLINQLLTQKKTELVKGFISRKNGKHYEAKIIMGDKGALFLEFEDGPQS